MTEFTHVPHRLQSSEKIHMATSFQMFFFFFHPKLTSSSVLSPASFLSFLFRSSFLVCVWVCAFIIFFCSYLGDPLDQGYFPVGESLNLSNTTQYKVTGITQREVALAVQLILNFAKLYLFFPSTSRALHYFRVPSRCKFSELRGVCLCGNVWPPQTSGHGPDKVCAGGRGENTCAIGFLLASRLPLNPPTVRYVGRSSAKEIHGVRHWVKLRVRLQPLMPVMDSRGLPLSTPKFSLSFSLAKGASTGSSTRCGRGRPCSLPSEADVGLHVWHWQSQLSAGTHTDLQSSLSRLQLPHVRR